MIYTKNGNFKVQKININYRPEQIIGKFKIFKII